VVIYGHQIAAELASSGEFRKPPRTARPHGARQKIGGNCASPVGREAIEPVERQGDAANAVAADSLMD